MDGERAEGDDAGGTESFTDPTRKLINGPELSGPVDARVVELFAGVGGFRLGLEAAGWKVIWSNQWEPKIQAQHASECYVHHFGEEGHVNEDITEVPSEAIPDHDLLTAGFPCQDYSVATTLNKAKGIQGKKGVLWWEIYRVLEDKCPPYVLLENVNRLLRSPAEQRGRDFGIVLACLARLGYRAEWRVINAADYGFPQRRRRVFILAAHEDTPLGEWIGSKAAEGDYLTRDGFFASEFPVVVKNQTLNVERDPDGVMPDDVERVSDVFEFHFKKAGVMSDRAIWTRDVEPDREEPTPLRDILEADVPEEYYVPEEDVDDWRYAKGAKEEQRVTDEGYAYTYKEGGMEFPDPIDRPARTILTSEGGKTPSRARHIIEDPQTGQLRILTPVEVERVMGFPDGWTDTGMPDNWRYTCMGNALVVGLVERMGQRLMRMVAHQEGPYQSSSVAAEAA